MVKINIFVSGRMTSPDSWEMASVLISGCKVAFRQFMMLMRLIFQSSIRMFSRIVFKINCFVRLTTSYSWDIVCVLISC